MCHPLLTSAYRYFFMRKAAVYSATTTVFRLPGCFETKCRGIIYHICVHGTRVDQKCQNWHKFQKKCQNCQKCMYFLTGVLPLTNRNKHILAHRHRLHTPAELLTCTYVILQRRPSWLSIFLASWRAFYPRALSYHAALHVEQYYGTGVQHIYQEGLYLEVECNNKSGNWCKEPLKCLWL